MTPEIIKERIEFVFDIPDLATRNRKQRMVVARKLYAKHCKMYLNKYYSIDKLGSFIGRKHDVMIYYFKESDYLENKYPEYEQEYKALKQFYNSDKVNHVDYHAKIVLREMKKLTDYENNIN